MHEIPPSNVAACATPIFMNIGRAAIGSPAATSERMIVFAEIALAPMDP